MLVVLWLWGGLLLSIVPASAWQGTQDNKPPVELGRMAEFELASEGRKACVAGALANPQTTPRAQQTVKEAHGYLEILGQSDQQIQDGKLPPWVLMMHQAIEGQDPIACNAVWAQVMKEHLEQLGARQRRNKPGGRAKREPAEGI